MIKGSYILLDTNILNYLLSKDASLASQTKDVLDLLSEVSGNTFVVSEFSHYELLRSCSPVKSKKCKELLVGLITIRNDEARLNRATRLYSLYSAIPCVKNRLNGVSDVDVFIGALIFTDKKPYLLTSDYNDFPRPFFLEKDRWEIKRPGGKSLYYYLLQADLDTFN